MADFVFASLPIPNWYFLILFYNLGYQFGVFNKAIDCEIYYSYNDLMGILAVFEFAIFLSTVLFSQAGNLKARTEFGNE